MYYDESGFKITASLKASWTLPLPLPVVSVPHLENFQTILKPSCRGVHFSLPEAMMQGYFHEESGCEELELINYPVSIPQWMAYQLLLVLHHDPGVGGLIIGTR